MTKKEQIDSIQRKVEQLRAKGVDASVYEAKLRALVGEAPRRGRRKAQ